MSRARHQVIQLPPPADLARTKNSSTFYVSRQTTPALSSALTHILEELQRELGLTNNAADEPDQRDPVEIEALLRAVAERAGFQLSSFERDEVLAYLEREQKPFGILQALAEDEQITDIIVAGYATIAVQQHRSNYRTDLCFPSRAQYEAFVERLLKRAGTTYSTKKPIADGMIGSFARVHAVHRSICEDGPYLTIRFNRFSEVTLQDLEDSGLAPKALLNYLRRLVLTGHTILVAGEVGTGKTTLTRALAGSIAPNESILVIEDTPEIKLEHPHVRYVRTREANTDGAGRVAPAECIRGGMRMAMNRIIFGEMRDAEAAEAFIDVCASGHPGLSTIHSRTAIEALTRLELFLGRAQRGAAAAVITRQIATAVQVVVQLDLCRQTGHRRIVEVRELGSVADETLRQREIFHYEILNGLPTWKILNRISFYRSALEQGTDPLRLAELPPVLELDFSTAYREVTF